MVAKLIEKTGLDTVDFDELTPDETLVIFGKAIRLGYMVGYFARLLERDGDEA